MPPAPPPYPPARPADPQSLLEAAPAPLLRVDADGRVHWANEAACALLGRPAGWAGALLDDILGLAPGGWRAPGHAPLEAPALGRWLTLRRRGLDDGTQLLHLEDAGALVAQQRELDRQRELLDLAQEFGRLGLWERDARTMQGRWDRHVYKFWGLAPDAHRPEFANAVAAIVDEDREAFERTFRESLGRPGHYAVRFRVRRPDGGVTHLHSQWIVKADAEGRPTHAQGIMVDDSEAVAATRRQLEVTSQLAMAEELADLTLWRHDLVTDRLHYNAQGWRFIGSEPRPDGLPVDEARALIHPDDVSQVTDAGRTATASSAPVDLQARYRRADGRWRHVMTRLAVERDERGQPRAFVGVSLDITSHADALARARALSERFDLAARTAGVGHWSREGDAERATWSEQMRALHGLEPDEPVPTLKEWREGFVHPDDREAVRRKFGEWLAGEAATARGEFRIVRRDGSVRHLMTHSHVERGGAQPTLFGIAIDVTDRRLSDQALHRAEQRAALAARGAGLGTWELDLRSGSIHWDEQMWRLRGLPPRESPPSRIEMLATVHPQDRPQAVQRIDEAAGSADLIEHSFRVVWPDGSVRWLSSRSTTVRDREGQALRRIGVNWDITAARRASEERRERETAERASQAKSQFLTRMSHELRTPLNAVLGFTQLLLADGATIDGATRQQRLQYIKAAGEHLLDLINDVLDLASLDSGELRVQVEAVPLAPLLAEALPLLEPLRAAQGLRVGCRVGELAVRADRTRLRQVLLNLLSNALKYNRAGGQVEVLAEAVDGVVRLTVRDTGRGMTPDQMRQLYQPFNRLGLEGTGIEGTGIGLAIVKALVDRMGGRIRVASEPGVGTRFELQLPAAGTAEAADAPAGRTAAGQATRDRAPAGPRRLLYVEDNPVNTMIVQQLLDSRPDIELLTAEDGASGLATAARARPALVLLDMQLPDMGGLEVLRRLRADPATAAIPCIALSASAQPEEVERARAAGMSDYWSKPLDLGAFLAALDRWLGPPGAA